MWDETMELANRFGCIEEESNYIVFGMTSSIAAVRI